MVDSPNQKEHSDSTQQGAGDQTRGAPLGAVAHAIHPAHGSQPIKEKWWQQPEHIIQVAILVFVASYTILTLCLFLTSRDTEQRSLRAYIGATPDKIIKTGEDTWAIQIAAHNYGQTPARAVQINGGWELLAFAKGKEVLAPQHFAYVRSEDSSGLDVYPTKDGTTSLPPFAADMVAQMRAYSGPLKIYTAGVVTYEDVFGNFWYTSYCAIITPRDFVTAIDKPNTIITFDWCIAKYNHAS